MHRSSGVTGWIQLEIIGGKLRQNWPYLICLGIQSTAALTILTGIAQAFRTVVDNLGVLHEVSPIEVAVIVATVCAFQVTYWYRFNRVKIPRWRGVVFGHIAGFCSRLSFIFGGALFSVFFLRHAPQLSSSEGAMILLPRIAMLLPSLFCLYCYTLELDRLANMLQSPEGPNLQSL